MSIKIRTKVATLLGYENIQREGTKLTGWRNGYRKELPKYESSLDAIYRAFEEMRIDFALLGLFSSDENAVSQGFFSSCPHGDGDDFSTHPAKALCELFIKKMEGADVSKP